MNLFFQLHLFFLLLGLSPAGIRAGRSHELLVYLFQIFVLVVKRLEIETSLPIELALVLDGISHLQFLARHIRPLIPVIRGVISQRAIRPIQHGDELQGKIPRHIKLLIIFQWRTQISDTLLHGILPYLIRVWIQLLVDLHIRFLDAGVRPRGEGHAQVVREIPAQAEGSIP